MDRRGRSRAPIAAHEWAAKQHLEPLYAQCKQEDQELEHQMRDEMMNTTGMGHRLKMQQEMEQGYDYPGTAPPCRGRIDPGENQEPAGNDPGT